MLIALNKHLFFIDHQFVMMIKRIVKMVFRPEETDTFLQLFSEKKKMIRNFEGCRHLELLRGTQDPTVFITYSFWENEAALEAYRHSALFKDTWAQTKILFAQKAEAWSVELIAE